MGSISWMNYERSAQYYDLLYSWKDYSGEAVRLHEIIQQRNPGATTLLDVACGTGKHLELLREHYAVEGIDIAPEFVTLALQRNPEATITKADMTSFDLGRRFDAITCLFSAIGYATTEETLDSSVRSMADHLTGGGVLIVEPWLHPDSYTVGHVGSLMVEDEGMAIARMNLAEKRGDVSIMDMHHLVGTPAGVEHFVERHELALFTHERYLEAFRSASLTVDHDADGLMGRGLYVGVKEAD